MKKGSRDGHESRANGRTAERADGTRPYQFGDPISELELSATLRNAIARAQGEARHADAASSDAPAAVATPGGGGTRLADQDRGAGL